MLRRLALLAAVFVNAFAQSFDVASIKPNSANDNRFMLRPPQNGAFMAIGVTVKMLVMSAYDVQAFQVSGGPSWMSTERWDIQAKAAGATGLMPRSQFDAMLRALLENRFQLKVRREAKEMPTYSLTIDKKGPKLTPHGDSSTPRGSMRVGYGLLRQQKAPVATLAAQLSVQLGRVVVDETGLSGQYDYALEWALEPGQGGPEALGLPPNPNLPIAPADPDRPSIFTALQEQLGLRLESSKGQVDMIVIESVEKPSEN